MTEANTAEVKSNSRRLFLKRGIATTAVLLGGSLAVRHEAKKGDEGIQTNSGVFIPLYENHNHEFRTVVIPCLTTRVKRQRNPYK